MASLVWVLVAAMTLLAGVVGAAVVLVATGRVGDDLLRQQVIPWALLTLGSIITTILVLLAR